MQHTMDSKNTNKCSVFSFKIFKTYVISVKWQALKPKEKPQRAKCFLVIGYIFYHESTWIGNRQGVKMI